MTMFEPMAAAEVFRDYLASKGLSEAALSVRDGVEAMLDFYRDARASGCALQDADMLLFQWGTYDRLFLPRAGETGEAFDLDLTRQLIAGGGEDDDIWQLSLTFTFEPVAPLRALGSGDRWCHTVQQLREFRDYVLTSGPFTACSGLSVRRRTLDYQCAG